LAMAKKQDYYEILGIGRDATQNDIKTAYRRLARDHHPDVNPGDQTAEHRFKNINEAYQVLSDSAKRQVYDRFGHEGLNQSFDASYTAGDFGGLGDIFDMFFGTGTRGATRGRPRAERGNDLRYDLEMTLQQAFEGMDTSFSRTRMEACEACSSSGTDPESHPETCPACNGAGEVRHQQHTIFGTQIRITICPRCHGEGTTQSNPCKKCSGQCRALRTSTKTVHIPAGVDTGTQIRMPGEGDAGLRGGPPGDLYIITHIQKHELFERKGNDLWYQIPISFVLATLGGTIEVRTIDGAEKLHIAAGTQFGEVYTLRHKGMPGLNEGPVGDLNVVIKVETPAHLNDEQKTLLTQFAACRGEEIPDSHDKGFFERMKDVFSGL